MVEFRFTTGGPTALAQSRASVFFEGIFSTPRLQHPEGIAIGPDGWIWTGGESGQIFRIAPDASSIEEVASTGGFVLGIAFDGDRSLFACDLKDACVYRLDLKSRQLRRFTKPGISIPNYPLIDRERNRLLVSDSHDFKESGPGIWSYDLDTGEGGIWFDGPLVFGNGIALAHDGGAVFVCETFARRITRVAINSDGTAGAASTYVDQLPGLPDGIAFDDEGALFVGCYEPSRIVRVPPGGGSADVYLEDPTAHLLAHPTNIAFKGSDLYIANLGRWHVSRIATDTTGMPVYLRAEGVAQKAA